jgi:hypothetical protein
MRARDQHDDAIVDDIRFPEPQIAPLGLLLKPY